MDTYTEQQIRDAFDTTDRNGSVNQRRDVIAELTKPKEVFRAGQVYASKNNTTRSGYGRYEAMNNNADNLNDWRLLTQSEVGIGWVPAGASNIESSGLTPYGKLQEDYERLRDACFIALEKLSDTFDYGGNYSSQDQVAMMTTYAYDKRIEIADLLENSDD